MLVQANEVSTFGVETVAFTYLVWKVKNELVPTDNREMKVKMVGDLRKKITTEHKVKLTDQMEQVLKNFEEDKEPEGLCLPGSSKASQAAAAVKDSVPATTPDSTAERQSCPESSGQPSAPKKRSLRDALQGRAVQPRTG